MAPQTLEFILGLKGLKYVRLSEDAKQDGLGDGEGTFRSPSRDMYWPREGLVHAKCPHNSDHNKKGACPSQSCSCGMYATFDEPTVKGYTAEDDRAVFLLQGWPRFIVGNRNAWRASSVTVLAVVELPLTPIVLTLPAVPRFENPFPAPGSTMTVDALQHPTQNLMGHIAQDYFQVGSISMAIALAMMAENNRRYLPR